MSDVIPVEPPRSWFDDPKLTGPTALEVSDNGQVLGHAALWDSCHAGFRGECVPPPRSSAGYSRFHLGSVRCDDGTSVACGPLVVGKPHATLAAEADEAAQHYLADTRCCVADVRAGEDRFGIWVAGAARPGVTPAQLRALRASPLSGDWRPVRGRTELIALLAVNVPGFPVPRELAASGARLALAASAGKPGTASRAFALVAAGSNPREQAWRQDALRRGAAAKRRGDETLAAGLAQAIAQLDHRVAKRRAKLEARMRAFKPGLHGAKAEAPKAPVVDERERDLREHQQRTTRRRRAARPLTGEEHQS